MSAKRQSQESQWLEWRPARWTRRRAGDRPAPEGCTQAGVIPYRHHHGRVEVLLITSRTRGRWIIPKGNIEPHLNARESARMEAYEEAGVRGRIALVPVGQYAHGDPPTDQVVVYLMQVEQELPRWPEQHERQRRWMPLAEAKRRIDEDGVERLLTIVSELLY